MRSSIEFLPKSNFVRLIVMIIAALLLVGLVLALSTQSTSATWVPGDTIVVSNTTFAHPTPLYDDPSYFELQFRRVKQRVLQLLTIILEELPLRQSPFRLPQNTLSWRIIPL